jgi:hypothetical protein
VETKWPDASVSDVIPAAGLGGLSAVFRHFSPPKRRKIDGASNRNVDVIHRQFRNATLWMENVSVIASIAWETIDIRGTFGILPNFIGRIS